MIMVSSHPYESMVVVLNTQSRGVLDPNHLLNLVSRPHAGIQPDVMIHATG